MDDTKKRSLFDIEAENALKLNKNKFGRISLGSKIIGWILGGIVGLFASLIVLLPATVYNIFSYGFVGMKLWQWFVATTFDLKPISLLQAAGVMLLIRLFTHENTEQKIKGEKMSEKVVYVVGLMLIPWFTLLVGYIIHCLI